MAAGIGASLSTPAAQATNMSNSQRTSGGPTGLLLERVQAEPGPGTYDPKLKGSIGEGPNHSNFSDRSSVKILSKFKNFR